MKAVVQRVTRAEVNVDGETVGSIGGGLLVLLGAAAGDTEADCEKLADKITKLRIFSDENDKTNLSLGDVGGDILVVSQFTLCADCSHGNRPYFGDLAEEPVRAEQLYELFKAECGKRISGRVESGSFGADMKVSLLNDGPFTILLECRDGKII